MTDTIPSVQAGTLAPPQNNQNENSKQDSKQRKVEAPVADA